MKIKVKELNYSQVLALPVEKHISPRRPGILFRTLLKLLSLPEVLFQVTMGKSACHAPPRGLGASPTCFWFSFGPGTE